MLFQIPQRYRFSSKSQRSLLCSSWLLRCFRYHKGTDFQANHNTYRRLHLTTSVVLDTTKVQIFKQITTYSVTAACDITLFQIPQRYRFSSKSQHCSYRSSSLSCCFRYHKGTDFQANHNGCIEFPVMLHVVLDTTKVQIFKQITTDRDLPSCQKGCFRYHKGTDFQANHNDLHASWALSRVVLDTTKVQIFKQITTYQLVETSF